MLNLRFRARAQAAPPPGLGFFLRKKVFMSSTMNDSSLALMGCAQAGNQLLAVQTGLAIGRSASRRVLGIARASTALSDFSIYLFSISYFPFFLLLVLSSPAAAPEFIPSRPCPLFFSPLSFLLTPKLPRRGRILFPQTLIFV